MRVRRYEIRDRDAVLALAPRLTIGVAAWRDPQAVAAAVEGWIRTALDRMDTAAADPAGASIQPDTAVFVAEASEGRIVGAVTVSERDHVCGETDGYIGELMVAADKARQGVGRLLVAEAEAWARARGRARITLDTGAANTGAREFYAAIGYVEEDIRLTRAL